MASYSDSLSWVPSSLDSIPPNGQRAIDRAEGEAASQYLAKMAKLEVAQEAIWTRHLQEVARDDVADVRRLKAKHLGKEFATAEGEKGGGTVGDIIVCDDYHVNTEPRRPQPAGASPVPVGPSQGLPGWLKALLIGGAVATAGAGGFGLSQLLKPTSTSTSSHEGFLLELVPPK